MNYRFQVVYEDSEDSEGLGHLELVAQTLDEVYEYAKGLLGEVVIIAICRREAISKIIGMYKEK